MPETVAALMAAASTCWGGGGATETKQYPPQPPRGSQPRAAAVALLRVTHKGAACRAGLGDEGPGVWGLRLHLGLASLAVGRVEPDEWVGVGVRVGDRQVHAGRHLQHWFRV